MSASRRGMDRHLVVGHHVDALYDIYLPILRPFRPYEMASADEVKGPTTLTRTETPECGPDLV